MKEVLRMSCQAKLPGLGNATFSRESAYGVMHCAEPAGLTTGQSGTFPLAHGAAARVGRLRGYGNALVAPQAEAFIKTFMEWMDIS